VKGPIIRKNILHIEIAPEIQRVFYMTPDEVGYADLDRFGESVKLAGDLVPQDLVYEPTRREVYVSVRDPHLLVFDGMTGRKGDDVPLPGWYGVELESIPGRVFLSVGGRDGLYTIDAATHAVAPWPVEGRIVTPARIEADPSGQYLFLAYYREIVAIDIARATVLGRVVTYGTPSIAFDPGERVLIATWNDDPPPTRVVAFRASADGFAEIERYKNPNVGIVGVEPTSHGFVQAGSLSLLVWSSHPGQMFQRATSDRPR
jgi:DNA-binding beta-propeller fold protein YncE